MLTEAQHRTLNFIKAYMASEGFAPTIAEIAQGIGIKSRSTVHRHLQGIEQAGLIQIIPNKRRNIALVSERSLSANDTSLSIVGKIAAGKPIEAVPDDQALDIAALFLGANRYLLEVEGDSMIGDNICDGDLVVCEHAETAPTGSIVVALVDHSEATLKRIVRNADQTVTLLPSNPALKPMTYAADRVIVQGIFIGLLRIER